MKTFNDLTHDELIALDKTAILRWIDQTCAEEGISLLPMVAPAAPNFEPIEPEVEHFVVSGLRFGMESEAVAIRDALAACTSRRQTAKYGWQWMNPDHDSPDNERPEVSRVRVLSAQQAAEKFEEIKQRDKAKAAYEAEKQAFDRIVDARERIVTFVRGHVESANSLEWQRERLRSDFRRYVDLANGDERIARRFLLKAHSSADSTAPDLFPRGWNVSKACAADAG